MKHKSFTLLCFLFAVLHSTVVLAQRPTTLYVNAGYTGTTEDGSASFPFKTIRKALDKRAALGLAGMTTDEEIVVKPGEYFPKGTDMLIINRTNCGVNGKWLTIRSETPWAATIHGDSLFTTKFAAMLAVTDSAQYVKIKQFTFEHLRNNPALTQWKGTDGNYNATGPTVPSTYNGQPLVTPYGDTIYESKKDVKFGIQIVSDSRHINIFDNDISDISWTSAVDPLKPDSTLTEAEKKILRNAWPNDDCGPLSVLGSDKDAMHDITIDGNEVYKCNPGWSETVTINGYIDTFSVINNLIHDVKNIGIVAAGNYTWVVDSLNGFSTPAAQNYSRNGTISNNIVYNCQSPYAASAGIYLDGARNVLVERNQVYQNHVGISVGNETPNSHSGGHIIRNNIVYDNIWTGLVLGSNGFNAWVENVKLLNNTFYRNNSRVATLLTVKDGAGRVVIVNGVAVPDTFTDGGEIVSQRLSNSPDAPGAKIVVQNNIIRSRKGVTLSILVPFKTDSYSSASLVKSNLKNLLDWNYNLYYIEPGYNNAMNYDFASAGFTGNTYNFANYKTETGLDSNSKALELATAPTPDSVFIGGTTFPTRFALRQGSTAYNMGNPSSSFSGTNDYIYHSRILNGRIDAGALEYYSVSGKAGAGAPPSATVIPEANNAWLVYPNPIHDNFTVRLSLKADALTSIRITDISGRLLSAKMMSLQKGSNLVKINNLKQAGFRPGSYLLRVTGGSESKTFKLLIQ